MKILHTGDLHIGKSFHEFSLLEDQRYILQQILQELAKDEYDALFITGDIYDRANPSPEAVEVFNDFLVNIKQQFPLLNIFIISGNHDSAKRLSFGTDFFTSHTIYFSTKIEQSLTPVILEDKTGLKVEVFSLPFLTPGDIENEINHQKIMQYALEQIEKKRNSALPALLLAHVFTLGAATSDSERNILGTAEQISASLFEQFAYVALGHIHKPQKIHDRIFYAGSPLAYSFSESAYDKSLLKITLSKSENPQFPAIETENIPLRPLHPVERIEGFFEELLQDPKYEQYTNSYLEITLSDSILIENVAALLRKRFPYLLLIKNQNAIKEIKNQASSKVKNALNLEENIDAEKFFSAFIQDIYELAEIEESWKEETQIFKKIQQELHNETT